MTKTRTQPKMQIENYLASIYTALLLTVFLLGMPGGNYEAIIDYKYRLFLYISGGYVVVSAIIGFERLIVGDVKLPRSCKGISLAQTALLFYLAFTVLSSVLSSYDTLVGGARKEGMLTICIYVLSCLFLSRYMVPDKWMIWLLCVSCTLFCAICTIQLAGGNPFGFYPGELNYYGAGVYYQGEYLGTIGNTVLCAAFLCICVGLFVASWVCLDGGIRCATAVALFSMRQV